VGDQPLLIMLHFSVTEQYFAVLRLCHKYFYSATRCHQLLGNGVANCNVSL